MHTERAEVQLLADVSAGARLARIRRALRLPRNRQPPFLICTSRHRPIAESKGCGLLWSGLEWPVRRCDVELRPGLAPILLALRRGIPKVRRPFSPPRKSALPVHNHDLQVDLSIQGEDQEVYTGCCGGRYLGGQAWPLSFSRANSVDSQWGFVAPPTPSPPPHTHIPICLQALSSLFDTGCSCAAERGCPKGGGAAGLRARRGAALTQEDSRECAGANHQICLLTTEFHEMRK